MNNTLSKHYILGLEGEKFAINYLKNKKYKILENRWQFKNLEIDIIATKGKYLHIIEVKTRSTNYFGEPYTFVNKRKQNFIINATNYYVDKKNIDKEIQFDIISLVKTKNEFKLQYVENAFIPL